MMQKGKGRQAGEKSKGASFPSPLCKRFLDTMTGQQVLPTLLIHFSSLVGYFNYLFSHVKRAHYYSIDVCSNNVTGFDFGGRK